MKKFILILFLIVVALAILWLALRRPTNPNTEITPSFNPTPRPTTIVQTTPRPTPIVLDTNTPTLTISGVVVTNFAKTATTIDTYGDLTLNDMQLGYSIMYDPQENNFHISITKSPFDTYRQQAEMAFIQQLGISQQDACKLSVTIGTSRHINPDQANTDYPLSFCQR